MASRPRTDSLTTVELYALDGACNLIRRAFGTPYLVGTAATGGDYHDVDVRLMLDDAEFAAVCPTRERWELLCLAIGAYLANHTGLPIDFQIQQASEANAKYPQGHRNPLGMKRVFAGGGDGTPSWPSNVGSCSHAWCDCVKFEEQGDANSGGRR